MAKKKQPEPDDFFGQLLARAPDFGMTPSKGMYDLHQAQLNAAKQARQAAYANQLNAYQSAKATQNSIANLIQSKQQGNRGMATTASSNLASHYAQHLANQIQPSAPSKPMNPNKYQVNDTVTVRTGRTEFMVVRFEQTNDRYNPWIYYLMDAQGRQTREIEGDLKFVQSASGPKKVDVSFETVIMPDEKREQILEALEQINQYKLIFEQWGFGETIEKGKGVSMLFYGPPGTGKTLVCQAIATKLGKPLAVISTADIESSAPGEAERNIRKVFQEASEKKSIILFDECDSLIYTRQNVGPILSAQINELLSQIERFEGITLFTTNRLGTLDEAVNRRLALKLELALPTAAERVLIWKRMFPAKAPLDADVDWGKLATVEVSGGYIKNSVLRAARMAAIEKIPDIDKKIKMKHLRKALALETKSMIEFEEAREEQKTGIGRASGPVGTATMGRGRDMEIKRKVDMDMVERGMA